MKQKHKVKKKLERVVKAVIKNPFLLGLSLLIVVTLFLLTNLIVNKLTNNFVDSKADSSSVNSDDIKIPEGIENWEYYVHPDYKFSLYVPELLIKKEYDDPGDYLFFVRFEQNKVSKDKGLAVGVSERSLEEEEKKTRELIEQGLSDAKSKREELKLTKYDAIRLDYEESVGLEPRSIVLVRNGGFTYSISTHPEQIDKVLSGFVFID
jgi:hypothetical protein